MEETKTEGNKLIAEYMGGEFFENGLVYFKHWQDNQRYFKRDNLKYHVSWNWLMPVVEKIAKTKVLWENSEDIDFHYPRTFGMISEEGKVMVRFNGCALFEADTLIEATWLSVIDYLKIWQPVQQLHESNQQTH